MNQRLLLFENAMSQGDALAMTCLLLALFGFLGYWWAHYSEVLQSKLNGLREGDAGKVVRVLILKAWGFVAMGLIPAWVLSAQFGWTTKSLGVTWPTETSPAVWAAWAGLILSTMFLSVAAGKEGAKNYPQMRVTSWSLSTMVWSGLAWTLYLSAYEFMFRGFLLFPMASVVGVWPAIAVSTTLYSITHFHKGKGETLWCLPVGVLTCWMTLETQSLLHTLSGHVLVAWFNTAYHVRRNPEMVWAGRIGRRSGG